MSKNRILYIEDTKFDQIAYSRFMEKMSNPYDTTIVSSVQEAKQILASENFDVIICDYALGDGTAFDILLMKLETPIILATGFGSEEIAVTAIKMGAKDYLIKDIDFNYLKMLPIRIENVLNQIQQDKDIVNARKIAEESTMLKETFLANMSHEIRTPMNAIIGFADLLSDSTLAQQEMEYVQLIKKAGENLLTIINDILDMSKINAGMMTFEENVFNIKDICNTLHLLLQNKAIDKKIDLDFHCDANVPDMIVGDPTRLTQILLNLAGNAIKFTEKGSVKLNLKILSQTDESILLEFSVIDTGIGIPKSELNHIFDRFRQAASHTTRKYGGTGLGLSIAKQLVELQGGTLKIKSEFNIGSNFSFSIPYKKCKNYTPELKNSEKKYNMEDLRRINTLLVEDNLLNVQLIKSLFSRNNLKLQIAENGSVCIEKLQENKYDIILMDMEMPVMNGYEATTVIRNVLKNDVPIVAMTAHTMTGEKEKCLSFGMNDFISKPINSNLLFEKMYKLTCNE